MFTISIYAMGKKRLKMKPEIKVNDRVRFRTDGEIGKILNLLGYDNHNYEVLHINNVMCEIFDLNDINDLDNDSINVPSIMLEICNDFTDIQVGDEVEVICAWPTLQNKVYNGKVSITADTSFMVYSIWFVAKTGISECGRHKILRIIKKAESKLLLADAKVGDLVKLRNGKYKQLKYAETSYPIRFGYDEFGLTVYVSETGMYRKKGEDERDIVEHQPLAPEGSAEWTRQMQKMGHSVCHPNSGFSHYRDDEDIPTERMYANNWQIYEQRPKPKFEVGQWVEIVDDDNLCLTEHCMVEEIDTFCPKSPSYKVDDVWYGSDGKPRRIMSDIKNHISEAIPAPEVVLDFGFISGTVCKCDDIGMEDTHFYVHSIDDESLSVITFAMLKEPIKSTVLALLERQKKENGNE